MARSMHGRRVASSVIRDALTQILAKQDQPASARDLATAVYHFTGDDRVGYEKVAIALRAMAADGTVRKTSTGLWEAVQS